MALKGPDLKGVTLRAQLLWKGEKGKTKLKNPCFSLSLWANFKKKGPSQNFLGKFLGPQIFLGNFLSRRLGAPGAPRERV